MDATYLIMWGGFILSAYAVVGNDSIQTLGTFLTSNEDRPWWQLWLYAGSILALTLIVGYITSDHDVSYGRLRVEVADLVAEGGGAPALGEESDEESLYRYPSPRNIPGFGWAYLLPPLVLMILTRTGIPVSTSFLILTFFAPKGLMDMVQKSVLGYIVAFVGALVLYFIIAKLLSRRFIVSSIPDNKRRMWMALQWLSTGFLWSQWLIQDFANIFVYLNRSITRIELGVSLVILLAMLAYIFSQRGGSIQAIVRSKTNTQDVRSATIIDFTFAVILAIFADLSKIPMSTTWVFLGLLAGREIAIRWRLGRGSDADDFLDEDEVGFALDADRHVHPMSLSRDTWLMVGRDLGKVTLGLAISVGLVFLMTYLTGRGTDFTN